MPGPSVPKPPREALEQHLRKVYAEGFDASGIVVEYASQMAIDAGNRATFLLAAVAWHEDVMERLERLEEWVGDLMDEKGED